MLSAFFFSEQDSDLILEGVIAASFILGQPVDSEKFVDQSIDHYQKCFIELAKLPAEFAKEICVQVLFSIQDEIFSGGCMLCHE